MGSEIPIIDSHIHLFPASELTNFAWYKPESPLAKQHSVEEYKAAISPAADSLRGFIFVETDRVNGDDTKEKESPAGWEKGPLKEVAWVRRIVDGKPREGEGHSPEDSRLLVAWVPWAPVTGGPEVLETYLARVKEEAGDDAWKKVRGFRYLLQDKPSGTALQDGFIEGLKLLGRKGYVFDVGVNQHERGRLQLEEAVEMIDRAHDGVEEDQKVVFILSMFLSALPFSGYYSIDTHSSVSFRRRRDPTNTVK